MAKKSTHFGTKISFETDDGKAWIYSLSQLEKSIGKNISRLPFSMKVLLESVLRSIDDYTVTEENVVDTASWSGSSPTLKEIPFKPARVILQDFTGVPSVVDFAAMRSAMERMGGDPQKINPVIPAHLVIDHSVQVDFFGEKIALKKNTELEFKRNRERYEFLRWAQQAFNNFTVIPPESGIVHQVNLEYIAQGVWSKKEGNECILYPDSLVGTDSHTTMINGLGIVGWGVGGIEAEAVMLGQPLYMLLPEVVGVRLTGSLKEGVTATDLTLTITEKLRGKNVVGKFVEFFGSGLQELTLPDRATIANMAPEYGATMGFFPVDKESLHYLECTGRSQKQINLVERYTKEQGLFHTAETPDPEFSSLVDINLDDIEPSVAGPKRPQDRISLSQIAKEFRKTLTFPTGPKGYGLPKTHLDAQAVVQKKGNTESLAHGSIVLAAITSCTNTSNPSVMISAGLVAKKAVEYGLSMPSYIKTSMAPGSKVVTDYLHKANLDTYLEKLGFHTVGYGCTTCIGNSGPLPDEVVNAITEGDLIVSGILSGNRNFEGRIHPYIKANFLASPPLVVAYALAGSITVDLTKDPIGKTKAGKNIYLRDLWPSHQEVAKIYRRVFGAEMFNKAYFAIEESNERWNNLQVKEGDLYNWNQQSTYIQEPPFFIDLPEKPSAIASINQARVLVKVGDSVTTDHISPAGAIPKDSPTAKYLTDHGVAPADFNSFGSRRGNDQVMTRGTFGNIRLRNQLAPDTEGGWTSHLPSNEIMSIFEASKRYEQDNTPLLVLAGKEYGTGSSRDWAAKGTLLLGVKAVLAESYERIHRSNLVGMGVLPLQFLSGETASSLGLTGKEYYTICIDDTLSPRQKVTIEITSDTGDKKIISTVCRIDTPVEISYYHHGGILQTVLRNFLAS